MRAAPGLVEDDVRPRSFLEQQRVFDSPYGERRHYWKGSFVRELPDELIDELLARIGALDRPGSHVLIESLHGAPKDAEAEHGALCFRHAAFNVSAMAVWQGPGRGRAAHRLGARDCSGDRAVVVRRRLRQLHAA